MTATWESKDVWDWDIDASFKWAGARHFLMIRPTCSGHVDLEQVARLIMGARSERAPR
jgi:hypothetical protein